MRIKHIVSYRVGAALLCVLLLGCSNPSDTANMAEQVADDYYQALKNKDFEKAAGYFMNTRAEPRTYWLDEIRDNDGKLGELQSYKLVNKVVNTVYSGTRYTLRFNNHYAKGITYETLILFDGVSSFGGGDDSGDKRPKIEAMTIRIKGS